MKIFSGSSNVPLTEKIAEHLHLSLSQVEEHIFPDGERRVRVAEDVVEEHAVIVLSTSTPVDQHCMELFLLIDSLKRSGAATVTAVLPYLGYQRQDHVFREGEAVSLEVIIKILESLKIDRLISLDLHSSRIPNLFSGNTSVSHLSALPLFAEKIKTLFPHLKERKKDFVLVSPDMGGIRRIEILSKLLDNMSWVAIEKNRDLETGKLKDTEISQGNLEGKTTAIIVDDMIASGETAVKAAVLLQDSGIEEMYIFATHPIFSSDAPEKLEKSNIKKLFVTDSVLIPSEKRFGKLEIISVAGLIAEELVR